MQSHTKPYWKARSTTQNSFFAGQETNCSIQIVNLNEKLHTWSMTTTIDVMSLFSLPTQQYNSLYSDITLQSLTP